MSGTPGRQLSGIDINDKGCIVVLARGVCMVASHLGAGGCTHEGKRDCLMVPRGGHVAPTPADLTIVFCC